MWKWALPLLAMLTLPAFALPAPLLSLPDRAGKVVDLATLRGKVVYVDFWASWCGPCRHSFPFMNALAARHAKDGLVVIAVNLDTDSKDAAAFLQRYPAQFTVLYDAAGAMPGNWGVTGMPTSYLIDRHGELRTRHVGFRDDDVGALNAEIDALLKEP
jgi:thiol-disulfide isomerase/thioredoxin